MAKIKTKEEIAIMKKGGALLAKAVEAAAKEVRPGAVIADINAAAERVLRAGGGTPSFLGYQTYEEQPQYPSTLCISVDDEVVHGLGDRKRKLKEGEIVSLDAGTWYEGLATDMSISLPVGKISEEKRLLIERTRQSLVEALRVVRAGVSVRMIGKTIQAYLKPFGYGIVRDLVGHGVGHAVHENPNIPHFDDPSADRVKLVEGMTIAIEPMITMSGDYRVETGDDTWTVLTRDGSPAAHFEVTIAVTKDGYELITPWVV